MHRYIFKEILTIMVILGIPVVTNGQKSSTDSNTVPDYGGKLAYALTWIGEHPDSWFIGHGAIHYVGLVNEKLAIEDWGIDREERDWNSTNESPTTLKGALAESWELPDNQTIILHIRKGVRWHDKPPMSGRELTAEDIAYNFHRFLGMCSFNKASKIAVSFKGVQFESITANNDDWTVTFELKKPSFLALSEILAGVGYWIYPPRGY